MKHIIILALSAVVCFSCVPEDEDFRGLDPLLLGQDFSKVCPKAVFRKVMDDEYFAETFEVEKGVGTLYNVNVTTVKGKISEVRFSTGKGTHRAALNTVMRQLDQVDLGKAALQLMAKQHVVLRAYVSRDTKTNFFVSGLTDPYGGKKSIPYHYQYQRAAPAERNTTK
jgi:hypothetical protein